MTKFKKIAKTASVGMAVAALTMSMTVSAFAAPQGSDAGNPNTTYSGTVGTTTFTPTDGEEGTYSVPSTKDRCTMKVYGITVKGDPALTVVKGYHIIEGNYNQYGFLGWTETEAAADIAEFASFQHTTDNVAQVVMIDNTKDSPNYNKGLILTEQNITDIARAITTDAEKKAAFESVDFTYDTATGAFVARNAEAGSYLVVVEAENAGLIYGPMIISNDYASANVAQSLSNVTATADGNVTKSLHDDAQFDYWKSSDYQKGVNKDANNTFNDKYSFQLSGSTAYDEENQQYVFKIGGLDTNDNKDKSPQEQAEYLTSHKKVTYYRDTQANGEVYALANVDDNAAKFETMALKGQAYAKKSTLPLEKNIRNASVPKFYANNVAEDSKLGYSKFDDVREGDTVAFDVMTMIPNYSSNLFKDEQQFLFRLTDTQHEGLKAVDKANIKVYAADSSSVDAQSIAADIVKDDNLLAEGEDTFTLTVDKDGNKFTIDFAKAYCLANPGKNIVVSYTTEVTDQAALGLNGNKNEVYLDYTTLPTQPGSDKPSRGHKFDFCIQYTFSPTAFKLGEDGEVVAGDGAVDEETAEEIAALEQVTKPLAGAKFKLQRVGTNYSADENAVSDKDYGYKIDADLDAFPDTDGYATWYMTSDENGIIKFDSDYDGIDEGIYTLQEIEAPPGYVLNSKIYVINVKPQYDENVQQFIGTDVLVTSEGDYTGMTFVDGTNYEYDKYGKLLSEYTYSEWFSKQADEYDGNIEDLAVPAGSEKLVTTIKYESDDSMDKTAEADLVAILNTKLAKLPQTGGMGTIIFTAIGVLLMAGGAAGILIIRKKKSSN